MPTPEEWIKNLNSADPLEKIAARINLLRTWPDHREEDKKEHMYFDLSSIVHKHSGVAVDYVADLKDINEKAFAIRAVYFGVIGSTRELTEEEQTDNTKAKKKLSGILENFTDSLPKVETADSKAELARIIATSYGLEKAVSAVDVLWAMGWNTLVYPSLYHSYEIEHCSEVLTSVVINSQHPEVGRKALGLIGQVPNERGDNYRDKHLKKIILSRNIDMAIAAVDLFIETKCAESGEPRINIARDMVSVCERTIVDREPKYEYAQQPVVEYTFDLVMKLIPEEKRMEFAYGHVPQGHIRQSSPPGLKAKAHKYLNEHIDDITKIKNMGNRDNILVYLMRRGEEGIGEKAVDYIAQSPKGLMDGVENIAQLVGADLTQFHSDARHRIIKWACKYVREFVKLEDKELARNALHVLKMQPQFLDGYCKYDSPETGKYIYDLAEEELAKLPKPPTEEATLAELFGVKESKP